jgi:hypothetical protein
VVDNGVYLVNISFNQQQQKVESYQAVRIGELQTSTGPVYISENNKPQICISDGLLLYVYDPTLSPSFQAITTSFIPGYLDFHDTYFLCAARADGFYSPPANNTWRLSGQNDGTTWADDAASIGLLQTKPDNVQAVIRVPSKGNMVFVFGNTVIEPWFDVGYQLFPYQRNTSANVDYGCLNPTTIARSDDIVVWLGINEQSGPVILYSQGGTPEKVSTDGIDYFLSQLQNPSDSQAFIYRQDGHIFYHINWYTDNVSLFVDFLEDGTHKIFHACDENGNYFIASYMAFFNNQYYFLSKNNGNLYAFDTSFTTYDGKTVPRIRTCKNVRQVTQDYFIGNDVGFTIESGNTNYELQDLGPIYLITQDLFPEPLYLVAQNGNQLVTQGMYINFITQNGTNLVTQFGVNLVSEQLDTTDFNLLIAQQGDFNNLYTAPPYKLITQGAYIYLETEQDALLATQNGFNLVSQQFDETDFFYLISEQNDLQNTVPKVGLSISIDGGEHFSSSDDIEMPPIGQRKNKLMWWQLGAANNMVCQFRFWGLGRFVATDGVLNIRQ